MNQSRFALLKLILIRHHSPGEPMPKVHLATDTPDQAYNLGRLLAILARLQKQAHEGKLEGPGIVQRYYTGAASSPQTVFPILINLHHHHLRKLEQQGAIGLRRADGYRARIGDVLKRVPKDGDGNPQFKGVFDLKEQARFALGFYQQHAYDRTVSNVRHLLGEAGKALKAGKSDEVEAKLTEASQVVNENDYPDLVRLVAAQSRILNS
jgi:CRISPR-associated protein Csd1